MLRIAGGIISSLIGQVSSVDQETIADRLVKAAEDGQVETVRDLLRKHPSEVDSVVGGGITALMWASYWGRTYVVQVLLDASASINKKDDKGESALHYSMLCGNVDVVKTLLERGAQINSVDGNGDTPLFYAIKNGYTEVIEQLINNPEIDLSMKNNQGQNLLHCASQCSWWWIRDPRVKPTVEKLLQAGLDVNSVDGDGDTPLFCAIRNWNTEVIELLINHPEIDLSIKNKQGQNLLHWAINILFRPTDEPKVKQIVEKLLQAGLDINSLDGNGDTPLFYAIKNEITEVIELLINHPEIDLSIKNNQGQNLLHCVSQWPKQWIFEPTVKQNVEKLLQAGLDVNSVDSDGNTVLHNAIYSGCKEVIEVLINHPKIDFSLKNKYGHNVLHFAVMEEKVVNRAEIIERLLQKGASVNSLDNDRDTPLHNAIYREYIEVIKVLINHQNIDFSLKNKKGFNPLHFALMAEKVVKRPEIVQLLLQNGADVNSMDGDGYPLLHNAIYLGYTEIIELLINQPQIDFSLKNTNGHNVLHFAIMEEKVVNRLEVIQTLLQMHADINSVDEDLNTALHHAVYKGDSEIIKLLISQSKIDFSLKNKQGFNVLDCVLRGKNVINRLDVIKLLLENMKDINYVDDDGNTPLHYAVYMGETEVMELLINHPKTDFSLKNKKGFNVLDIALRADNVVNRPELVHLLLEKGIDVNSKDKDGDSPIHIAVDKGETEVTELLIDQPNIDLSLCNDKGFTVLSLAVLINDLITTKLLIDKHPSIINTKDGNGLTALHLAAHNGHDQVVSFLIENGADVEVTNYELQTPLQMAVKQSELLTIELLVTNGAGLNAIDGDGNTCLHLAIMKHSDSTQEDSDSSLTLTALTIVCFLVKKGADLTIKNSQGMTAFDLIQDPEKRKNFKKLVETCI